MGKSETLDSPQSSSFSLDPQLSRNLSSSRLNAQAPEFMPTRSTPQQQQQQPHQSHRMMIPSPPPPGMLHVYPPPPPPTAFHLPVHSPVPMPPHMVTIHHHVPMLNYHNHYHNPYQNHHHREQEVEAVEKKDQQKDHGAPSKNGLPEEATLKILNQVEYYFSDLNLATTDRLMRFINKDPEGYVPISVVASFKKIKALITTHSQLATVLQNSLKLVVSEDGKKVRRQHLLTESDMEDLRSRIIVAENLPEDHCHQNLMKMFSAVGSVKTMRTCQPQASGSGLSSASRSAKSDGMNYSDKLHAFVEYGSVELAERAEAELNDERNWRSGLRVHLMLRRASKPAHSRGKKAHDGEGHYEEDDASTSEQRSNVRQQDHSQLFHIHSHEYPGEEHSNDKEGGPKKGRKKGRGKGCGWAQYHNNRHNSRGNHVGTPPSASSNLVSYEQAAAAKQPPGPRMPDGTRGFAMGRGKRTAVNTA